MKKTTIVVMFVSILAKIAGFLRDITLSNVYGFSKINDAFQGATSIPTALISVVAAAFVTGVIPMLTRIARDDKARGDRFISNVMNIMFVASFFIMIFMLVAPELALTLVGGSGFDAATMQYAVGFVRALSFTVFSIVLVQLGTGYLNVKGSFVGPAMVTIPTNILVILGIILAGKLQNTTILIVAQFIGMLAQGVLILYFMNRREFDYSFHIDFTDEDLQLMLKLSLPLVFSAILGQINDNAMKTFATHLHGEGAMSMMNAVSRLIGFVQGVFITTILNVTYPSITHNVVHGTPEEVSKSFNEAILLLSICVIPAMAGFVGLAEQIISFVYDRGAVTPEEIQILTPIFIANSLALFSLAMRELLNRMHFAYQDMKYPVYFAAIFTVIFVLLMWGASSIFTTNRLAALMGAYSLSLFLLVFPLYFSLKRHMKVMRLSEIAPDFIKIVVASLGMYGAVVLAKSTFLASQVGSKTGVIFLILIGILVYVLLLLLLRVDFVRDLVQSFARKRQGEDN